MDFWLRRLLRRSSTRVGDYRDGGPDAEQCARLARIVRAIAGRDGPRVAVLYGVMPRSGTNYLQALLGLHSDLVADPLGIRELPLLAAVPHWRRAEAAFLDLYAGNAAVLGDLDLLAHVTGGLIARARAAHPEAHTLVFKVPHTRFLAYAPALFPDAQALVLTRSGPHLLQSTMKTWPPKRFGKTFADLCLEWRHATETALAVSAAADRARLRLWRYEDVLADPRGHLLEACGFLGLDPVRADLDGINRLPVLGSSELSRRDGAVSWQPVHPRADFNPAERPVQWTGRQRRLFQRLAGDTMARAGYAMPAPDHQTRTRTDPVRPA